MKAIIRTKFVAAVLGLATLAAPHAFAAAPAGESVSGVKMSCSSNYVGTLGFEFSKSGIRMAMDRMALIWVLRAPQWQGYCISESSKKFVSKPYEVWKQKFAMRTEQRGQKNHQYKVSKTRERSQVAGMTCTKYDIFEKFIAPPGSPEFVLPKGGKGSKGKQSAATGKGAVVAPSHGAKRGAENQNQLKPGEWNLTGQLWIADNVECPKQFSELLGSLLHIPIEAGLPMRVSYKMKNNKLITVFDTLKFDREKLPLVTFNPNLKGYKQVADEISLMLDEGDDSMMGDVLSGTHPGGRLGGMTGGRLSPGKEKDALDSLLHSK